MMQNFEEGEELIVLGEQRRSGDTTGKILKSIGYAIQHPGSMFSCEDIIGYEALQSMAIDLIEKIGANVEVYYRGQNTIGFKSLHQPCFQGSDGHMYKRVGV